MKKIISLLLISFILLQCCAVLSVTAESSTFNCYGKVTDRRGIDYPIAGAVVTIVDYNYDDVKSTTTDKNGNFYFNNLEISSFTFKVRVTYNDGSKTYTIPTSRTNRYNAQGMVHINENETRFYDYPPPIYSFIWGFIKTDNSETGRTLDGVVYLTNVNSEQKYYTYALKSGTNYGQYLFQVPVGTYSVYAQHEENGLIYQSQVKQITVTEGNTNVNQVPATVLLLPLTQPASAPQPDYTPNLQTNKISGFIRTMDGKGYSNADVSLYQITDDGQYNKPRTTIRTDDRGYYEFNYVSVTSDEGIEIATRKDFRISATYSNPEGIQSMANQTRSLYSPNFLWGAGLEQAARNQTVDITLPYALAGWVNITSDPPGALISVDGQPLYDGSGNQLKTPCTAFIDPGQRTVKLSADGYDDKTFPVDMVANQQHQDMFLSLSRPMIPSWVPALFALLILGVVAVIFLFILFKKKDMFLGPLGGLSASMKNKAGDMKAQRDIQKAHKAEIADRKRSEDHARLSSRAPPAKARLADEKRLPRIGGGKPAEYASVEEDDYKPSVVFANEIHKKPERSSVERVPNPVRREESIVPSRQVENDGRIRVPKSLPQPKEMSASVRDKERVLKYVKDHPDGVSFIQMSNDLDIVPNVLTLITKELVINDDIEKVKGMYYFKSHDASAEDSSSVVVWRLDGDK